MTSDQTPSAEERSPSIEDRASRVEAAEAGVRHELAETRDGGAAHEHVTATDAATEPGVTTASGLISVAAEPDSPTADQATASPVNRHGHHHPPDPNVGVVVGTTPRGAWLVAIGAAAVTIAAVVLLALAVGR